MHRVVKVHRRRRAWLRPPQLPPAPGQTRWCRHTHADPGHRSPCELGVAHRCHRERARRAGKEMRGDAARHNPSHRSPVARAEHQHARITLRRPAARALEVVDTAPRVACQRHRPGSRLPAREALGRPVVRATRTRPFPGRGERPVPRALPRGCPPGRSAATEPARARPRHALVRRVRPHRPVSHIQRTAPARAVDSTPSWAPGSTPTELTSSSSMIPACHAQSCGSSVRAPAVR
jgi:hypothetical protein